MSLTTSQQTDLYKLAVGMYAAAPGVVYMNQLANAVIAGATSSQLYDILAGSQSFQLQNSAYANFSTDTQFATTFCNKILGSTVTSANMTLAIGFVTDLITANGSGTHGRAVAMKTAIDALYGVSSSDANFGAAKAQFTNKITVAQYYTETQNGSSTDITVLQGTIATVTNDPATVTAAESTNASSAGQTFTLTTGLDNIVGTTGNDLIIGDNTTGQISAGDVVDGGGGTDTLKIAGTTSLPGTIKNVEIIDFLNTGTTNTQSSIPSGVTTLVFEGNLGGNISVSGMSPSITASVKGNTSGAAYNVGLTYGSADTSASLAFDGASNSSWDLGVVTLTGAAIATLNVSSSNNKSTVTQITSASNGVTTLNVTGNADLKITTALGTAVKTIAASSFTGGLNATLGTTTTDTSVTTGSGKDSINVAAAIAQKLTVDLGAGNDTLTVGTVAPTSLSTFNGGDGTDTVTFSAAAALTSSSGKLFTNFETLGIAGTGTFDASFISGITGIKVIADVGGAATSITNLPAAGPTVSVEVSQSATGPLTVALKDATGSSDSLAVTIGGSADVVIADKLTTTAIENITINSTTTQTGGTGDNKAQLDITNAKVLTITGDYKFTETYINAPSLTKIDASGITAGFVMGAALTGNANSVTYLGGNGRDTFLGAATAGAAGDTFRGGKGGDTLTAAGNTKSDTFIYALQTDSYFTATSSSGVDTINGFVSGTDLIDLTTFAFSGSQRAAVSKTITAGTSLTTTTRSGFFDDAGLNRGVAYAVDGANTVVYVDVDKNGAFDASLDLAIKLAGITSVTSADFLF